MSHERHIAGESHAKTGSWNEQPGITRREGKWGNFMSRKRRKSIIALSLMAAFLCTSANAQETQKSKSDPLMIQEQGSFAVGGSVTTAPGTFDPIKQGSYNPAGTDPAGQTLHGDQTLTSSARSQ
jgi:hypothetical protein